MSVKIRLKRMGAKKRPFYRIVVADSRAPRDGRFIDTLGYYNPCVEPADVKIDPDKAQMWLTRGAQPTDTATALLKKHGVLAPSAAPAAPAAEAPKPARKRATKPAAEASTESAAPAAQASAETAPEAQTAPEAEPVAQEPAS